MKRGLLGNEMLGISKRVKTKHGYFEPSESFVVLTVV